MSIYRTHREGGKGEGEGQISVHIPELTETGAGGDPIRQCPHTRIHRAGGKGVETQLDSVHVPEFMEREGRGWRPK